MIYLGSVGIRVFRAADGFVHHKEMGELIPLPRVGDVFTDVRGDDRTMRVSCHDESDMVILSLWAGKLCRASFRLPAGEVPRLIEALDGASVSSASASEPAAPAPRGAEPAVAEPAASSDPAAGPPVAAGDGLIDLGVMPTTDPKAPPVSGAFEILTVAPPPPIAEAC